MHKGDIPKSRLGLRTIPRRCVLRGVAKLAAARALSSGGNATVDNARVRVVIDIAFGDVVEPGVQEADLPVLLDFPVPKLRSYLRETVIAEKVQAMSALGLANSRLKDFYVVWVLIRSHKFEKDVLARQSRRRSNGASPRLPRCAPMC